MFELDGPKYLVGETVYPIANFTCDVVPISTILRNKSATFQNYHPRLPEYVHVTLSVAGVERWYWVDVDCLLPPGTAHKEEENAIASIKESMMKHVR